MGNLECSHGFDNREVQWRRDWPCSGQRLQDRLLRDTASAFDSTFVEKERHGKQFLAQDNRCWPIISGQKRWHVSCWGVFDAGV